MPPGRGSASRWTTRGGGRTIRRTAGAASAGSARSPGRPAGAVTTAPPTQTREWIHPVTGEISDVPVGIDPGWDYHPARHAAAGTAQALTDRLQRLLAPRAGMSGPRRATLERLARRQVETHLEGPGFQWFVERPRTSRPIRRRRHLRTYGRHDKATPIVVWAAARAAALHSRPVGLGRSRVASTNCVARSLGEKTSHVGRCPTMSHNVPDQKSL